MTDTRAFQLYLLSKMRAGSLVDGVLRSWGLSRAEMGATAHQLATQHGLDEVLHPADAYVDLLGPPRTDMAIPSGETSREYAGSRRFAFSLPLWPDVQFVVRRHPAGYAWGVGFEQEQELPVPSDVRPWHAAADALLRLAEGVRREEEWGDELDAVLTFTSLPEGSSSWRACFDLRLLQTWNRV